MNGEQELSVILEQHPDLHDGGYGTARPASFGTATPESRAALLARERAFVVCKWWIGDNLTPIKVTNRHHSSYGLKHLFESATGLYVTNGLFIAAMLACGYRMEKYPGYNPSFNVSETSIRAAEQAPRQPPWAVLRSE